MLYNAVILILAMNALQLGLEFGPVIPTSGLHQNYQTTSVIAGNVNLNNFQLDYRFTKLPSKINNQEYINWHTITVAYNYPFFQKGNRAFIASLGGNYNYFLRRLLRAQEKTYALGLRYGVGYQLKITGGELVDKIKPSLLATAYLNQVIQARDWNYNQIMTSNFFLSLLIGINFRVL
ncbi:MAG: hypothetical protein N2748_02945 [candidate division WOR-3 bacterium]|nr:hypothetical protein [candidate division WOR-3 bacterium]